MSAPSEAVSAGFFDPPREAPDDGYITGLQLLADFLEELRQSVMSGQRDSAAVLARNTLADAGRLLHFADYHGAGQGAAAWSFMNALGHVVVEAAVHLDTDRFCGDAAKRIAFVVRMRGAKAQNRAARGNGAAK